MFQEPGMKPLIQEEMSREDMQHGQQFPRRRFASNNKPAADAIVAFLPQFAAQRVLRMLVRAEEWEPASK